MAVPVMIIDGDVIAVHSHWTQDASRIVTEATVRTPNGDVVVSQLGGSVDGIGMITMPGPELLAVGMKVAVAAHRDVDLSQREHVVLDTVKVMAYPPGFVRTGPTKNGNYLYWEGTSVDVTLDDAGTTAITGDAEFGIIDAAISEWVRQTTSCSYFRMVNAGRKALEVGRDKVNLIKFRDTSWGRPATGDDPARSYSPSAAGLTTAVYVDDAKSDRDGAIIDADVELNGVNFAISVNQMSNSTASCKSELQNTLTHELGHLQGLEHPCLAPGDPPRTDGNGASVPACGLTTDTKITEATMYNFQDCGETKKETVSDDDIAAICAVYDINDAPDGGCCGASTGAGMPGASVLLAGTLLMMMRRRRSSTPA